MLELYDKMAEAAPEEIDKMMNTVGEIQTELEHSGFYSLDTKIEEGQFIQILTIWEG